MNAGVDSVERIDPLDLVDPERYARGGYPHAMWTRLRAEAPVARFEPPGYEPFWAIMKHADIIDIASQPLRFSSEQGISLRRVNQPPFPPQEFVLFLDPPRHGPMRRAANTRFTPRAARTRREDIERIALELLDEVSTKGATVEDDFVMRIAAPYPLAVVVWFLGAPREDWQMLFNWTNEVIGKEDPEFRRPGETPGQTIKRARGELRAYLKGLIEQRRRDPKDDLVSELLRATIDGKPLNEEQLVSYCEIIVEAGNETTRDALSGGMLAFCEHPDEWERLRANPALLPDAVEELLRWVSPIAHFERVATEDCEVRGVKIKAGEQVAMFFASGNRDEEVFEDPFTFRIDRRPNPHLAFGYGEHFCMGAHVARVELEVMFGLLLERMASFEMCGPVERVSSAVNAATKRLPLRYQMT